MPAENVGKGSMLAFVASEIEFSMTKLRFQPKRSVSSIYPLVTSVSGRLSTKQRTDLGTYPSINSMCREHVLHHLQNAPHRAVGLAIGA